MAPCASVRPQKSSALRSNTALECILNIATEFENAFSVTWARVPWNRGSWRSETSAAEKALAPLREPDGRVYFAGDYMTDMSSWMQGAFESARAVASALHRRALAGR